MSFVQKVKEVLNAPGNYGFFSQKHIANSLNWSPSAMSNVIKGKRNVPTRIVHRFHQSIQEIERRNNEIRLKYESKRVVKQEPPAQVPDTKLILSTIPFDELLTQLVDRVCQVLKDQGKQEQGEKLLSPAETCLLFQPKISLPTLNRWTKAGYIIMYRIGGRTWYKYSEIFNAAKELKLYKATKV